MLYDCTNYLNKPSDERPVAILYSNNIWDANKGSWDYLQDTNYQHMISNLDKIEDGRLIILDFECNDDDLFPEFIGTKKDSWMVDSRDYSGWRMERQRGRLIKIIKKVKELKPNNPVGVYGCCPIRDFWNSQKPEQSWIDANAFQMPIAYHCDFVAPSMYFFYESHLEKTKTYIRNMMDQAKQYRKPIIPFLRPRFHPSCKDATDPDKWIPFGYWQQCMEIIREYTDDVILWDISNPAFDYLASNTFGSNSAYHESAPSQ